MIGAVLNIVRSFAFVAAKIASAVPSLDGRYCISDRLNGPWPKGPFLWLHGASLGECKMLLNLAKCLRDDLAECPEILITSQKVEVVAYLRQHASGIVVASIAPADIPAALSKFVRDVQPLALILAENELWPGYLSAMARRLTKPSVALVSGRYRTSFPGVDFSAIGFACMQTSADKNRLEAAAGSALAPVVGGDWKILPSTRTRSCDARDSQAGPRGVDSVALLSVHIEEWGAVAEIVRASVRRNCSVVLVPRRLEEAEAFRSGLSSCGVKCLEWPLVCAGAVTLVDCFGLTQDVLKRCRVAVVGGSFCPRPGVHDFWEPLCAGVKTFVGPFSRGHEDMIAELVSAGVVTRLASASDFENLDLVDEKRMPACVDAQKEKVSDSYRQLLRFLEDLLK